MAKIVTAREKRDEKFLHQKTVPFDFSANSKKEISDLINEMKKSMIEADGIGLAANQIGLTCRVFVARVPDKDGRMKFYAVFNPTLTKISKNTAPLSEGCLSVPGTYGEVERALDVTLKGFDKLAKPLTIKARGLLAHVFQHEVDHLDGTLFIDKAIRTYDATEHEKHKG